jgi:hypothetical protein
LRHGTFVCALQSALKLRSAGVFAVAFVAEQLVSCGIPSVAWWLSRQSRFPVPAALSSILPAAENQEG